MTGSAGFALWLDMYVGAFRDPAALKNTACPDCGVRALRMIFVVRSYDEADGTAVFWCDSCHRGLQPLRGPVAEGGECRIRGTEAVPNYSFVLDDGLG